VPPHRRRGGGGEESGGHVLRETTSRGLCELSFYLSQIVGYFLLVGF